MPYYHTPDFTPHWVASLASMDTIHQLKKFVFKNQADQWVDSDSLRGKIHVANFFFTACPSLCPRTMGNMKELQRTFSSDNDVKLLSFSVLPERDSVAVLRAYAQQHQVEASKWELLTGNRKDLYETARRSYFADENLGIRKGENDFLHTENFILVDKNLRIRGIYNGTLPLEIEQLVEDIKTLKRE
ncbi:protein SCO1/2 [Runella defluvii]|uniref:Protein SCO1/2 n=1 Tax=Runella defluvii TaxID=370973 RepID=A0A7W6EPI2_9BACT|nr:SCO family protein [Runella defluvii]MBB3837630.1 protein SCO1/2 [Runella defluvii]